MRPGDGIAGRITGIGDEAAPDLTGQIDVARELGWSTLELRTVDGIALADLDTPAVHALADRLHSAGLGVVCLDSRIANWSRPVTADFAADLAELDRLAAHGRVLGCRSVRIMSWPNDGLPEDTWASRVISRVRRLARRAEDLGLELLHENCSGWAGASASRTLRLLHEVDSPVLRVLFDTGNGVAHGYDSVSLLEPLLPHVAHVHVKDGLPGERPGEAVYTLPGDGAARVADCLRLLEAHGYRGAYSLEPHLAVLPHEGTRRESADARGLFIRAAQRLAALPPGAAPAPGPGSASRSRPPGVDTGLLSHLLHTPTAGPLETGPGAPHALRAALHSYATAAARCGLDTLSLAPPRAADVLREGTPARVRAAVAADPAFLTGQPSLLLRLGPELPRERTVMFNVHLDTVAGGPPPAFDGTRFTGRGAVDAKGPAVALLAGIAAAARACPAVGRDVSVLVQAVAGEEGGALGTFGTRPLVEAGHVGRVNVFCEPTGLRHLPRATAASTARITVTGDDAVDDRPDAGHNATLLLGFLAQHLATALTPPSPGAPPATVCLAGLHTGTLHNKVHGTGSLALNLAHTCPEDGAATEAAVTRALAEGLREFTARYRAVPLFARTAADAARITRLDWEKRGLPALGAQPAWGDALMERAGIDRWPDEAPAFTCDAIWLHAVPGTYTTVFGPGGLDTHHAHADGEFVDLTDLERFASRVTALLVAFAADAAPAAWPAGHTTPPPAQAPDPAPPERTAVPRGPAPAASGQGPTSDPGDLPAPDAAPLTAQGTDPAAGPVDRDPAPDRGPATRTGTSSGGVPAPVPGTGTDPGTDTAASATDTTAGAAPATPPGAARAPAPEAGPAVPSGGVPAPDAAPGTPSGAGRAPGPVTPIRTEKAGTV
ncbi:M20/M25/M40 family metallo-hydrolase [Streptomyces sp. SCSIO 75703]|uniref:M20/M25/M40 family metallo-hydrolase n=1 Tax=Streptomyces sp. SCSIO 75703 TaxID=3112165 RepID=UPI0030CC69F8